MKLFGLYFGRGSSAVVAVGSQPSRRRCIGGCMGWTAARVYSTIVLAVTWFNAARFCVIYDGRETVGADLFAKLGLTTSSFLIGVLQTAYYFASHTGSLDRVFSRVNVSAADFAARYRRKAKVVTVVCWLMVSLNVIYYVYLEFTNDELNDMTLRFLIITLGASRSYVTVIKVVLVALQIPYITSWAFSQAMNYTNLLVVDNVMTYSK